MPYVNSWVNGIYPFHHYHSNAWELLLCVKGEALVQLGGPTGPRVDIRKGDLVLIPPGFAHKQLQARGGFTLLGSYPTVDGRSIPVDTLKGKPSSEEREKILHCKTPEEDPIVGLSIHELLVLEASSNLSTFRRSPN